MNDQNTSIRWMIRQRAELLREVRQWFDKRGFFEVQPPCLSSECIIDTHIEPIAIGSDQFGLPMELPQQYYLQTSPEAAMKRMLSADAPSIYSLGPAFRRGERGAEHNVEFTMLEWYELDSGYDEGVELLGQLATEILGRASFDVVCYRDLFYEKLGCDPIHADLRRLDGELAALDQELATSLSGDRDGLLEALWTLAIQPTLGEMQPLIVRNYPLSQAALACPAEDDNECAERFELFVGGVELANGYHELGDANILKERFESSNRERNRIGKTELPLPMKFLEAMDAGLPPCSGVALGFDRLLMIWSGCSSLDDILPLPIEIA